MNILTLIALVCLVIALVCSLGNHLLGVGWVPWFVGGMIAWLLSSSAHHTGVGVTVKR